MRTIGLFKDWYYEHSDKIGIIAALVLALALIFPLDKFLVSLLGLSGTTKYVIITLIDILITTMSFQKEIPNRKRAVLC